MKELDSENITTIEIQQLLDNNKITAQQACDLFTYVDVGFEWDENCINKIKNNKIQLSVNVYLWTDKDESLGNFQYDEHSWIDSLPVEFNIKTKEIKFDISQLNSIQKILFEDKQYEIEEAIVNNYETNFEELVKNN